MIERAKSGDHECALALIGYAGARIQKDGRIDGLLRDYMGEVLEAAYRQPDHLAQAFNLTRKPGRKADANRRRNERIVAMVESAHRIGYSLSVESDHSAFALVADACAEFPGGGVGLSPDAIAKIWGASVKGNNQGD